MPITHAFVSAKTDGADATVVRPSDWNAEHIGDIDITSDNITYTLNEYTTSSTLSGDNHIVLIDASGGGITVTLPAAASHTNRIYTIKKIDSSGNAVTVEANGTEKIDGEKTIVVNLQYAYITIVCDGDEWFIIGGEYVKMEDILRDIKEIQEETKNELKDIKLCLSKMSNLDFKED